MPLVPEKLSVALYRHEWRLVLAGLLVLEKQVVFKEPDFPQIIVDIHLAQRVIEKAVKREETPEDKPQENLQPQTPDE
jgi:Trm5-related predicted tRNA methylase